MFRFVTLKLEKEYHRLSLWYFVSFFYGIVFYFKSPLQLSTIINNFTISFIVGIVLLLIIFFTKTEKLLLTFCSAILLFFIIGVFVGFFRISNADTKILQKPSIFDIQAKIEEIKPTNNGIQLTLSDIVILSSSHFNKKRNNYRKDGRLGEDEFSLSKVRINLKTENMREVKKGDLIKLPVQLFPLKGALLPSGYDFGLYLYLSGIQANGYGLKKPEIIDSRASSSDSYWYFLYSKIRNIRIWVYNILIKVLGPGEGNFAAAILIGETKAIDPEMANNMRSSGIAHILSVSGLHLSLVALIFFNATRFLLNCSNYLSYKINIKTISGIVSIVGSFGYLLLSGCNIAATRAFIMTVLFILSVIFEKSAYPIRSVMIAGMLILIFSPEYIMHPSFQLSFSAVLCLISGYELYIRNQKIFGDSSGVVGSIKFYLFNNIYSSFLASIVTAPFVIYHFYKFATYSVLMNLIAVPIMSFFMMPLAVISLILMPFNDSAAAVILKLLGFFIKIVTDSAAYVVSLPYSLINTGYITDDSMLVYSFGFFWICLWQTKLRYFGLVIIIVSLIMMYLTPKPDFIYDHRIKALAIKNGDGLDIYAKKRVSNFTKEYWLSWYGITKVNIFEQEINFGDQLFEIPAFKTYNPCFERLLDYRALSNSAIVLGFCQTGCCVVRLGQDPIWTLVNHGH